MSRSILVVDDSPTERRLIANPLRKSGYLVSTAEDGEEAIVRANGEQPDLIVLDVVMPKKNGFQVCRKLKMSPNTKDIKIVMLTSKNQDTDRFWGLRQGADAYLTKPFAETLLLETVAELL